MCRQPDGFANFIDQYMHMQERPAAASGEQPSVLALGYTPICFPLFSANISSILHHRTEPCPSSTDRTDTLATASPDPNPKVSAMHRVVCANYDVPLQFARPFQ